jgi:hypothetical protein
MPQSQSFTLTASGQLNCLVTTVHVCEGFDPNVPPVPVPDMTQFQAIWDTGATNTAISQNVITGCGLKPVGMTLVGFGGGEQMCETFLINISLPNGVRFANVLVNKANTGAGADMLIGMDVIGTGDFAVTNQYGRTVFSFRCPSVACIDFVQEAIPATGRNDPCPCGSGKKYKKCHGAPPPIAPTT